MSNAFQQAAIKETSIPELKRSSGCYFTKNMRDLFELNEDDQIDLNSHQEKTFHIKEIFLRDNKNDSGIKK
jgi:hypothetical protein